MSAIETRPEKYRNIAFWRTAKGDCWGKLEDITETAINACKALLIVLSSKTLESEWCLREYLAACLNPHIGLDHILPVFIGSPDEEGYRAWDSELYKEIDESLYRAEYGAKIISKLSNL